MVGPSAKGSEKGIPSSRTSAPASAAACIIARLSSRLGCPAQMYGMSATSPRVARAWKASAIGREADGAEGGPEAEAASDMGPRKGEATSGGHVVGDTDVVPRRVGRLDHGASGRPRVRVDLVQTDGPGRSERHPHPVREDLHLGLM